MNSESPLHPAEERLLDAALAQHFAGTHANGPAARVSGWLVAAVLLLGLGVVATTMWRARDGRNDEVQEPASAPLPPEVTGDGRTQLEALPATTANLFAKIVDPRDLPVVARFEGLRCLRLWAEKIHIAGINTGKYHRRWGEPPADLLRPVAGLPRLEVLKLPRDLAVTPALLAPLAGHATLRELQFVGSGIVVDDAFVAALAAMPRLRALHLVFVDLDGDSLRRLARLPLESLELEWCSGLDANGWQALLSLRTLRRLAFKDWDWTTKKREAGAVGPWRPTAEDLLRLRELPRLRTLELQHCGLRDDELAVLPDTLQALTVLGHELTPDGFVHLRRFVAVEALDVGTARTQTGFFERESPAERKAAADAVAAAMLTLRLTDLRYVGDVTPDLLQALSQQHALTQLQLVSRGIADLGSLPRLPKLATLKLQETGGPTTLTPDTLRPLRDCASLRELAVHVEEIDDAAVKALFGERVAVTTRSWKVVPKK